MDKLGRVISAADKIVTSPAAIGVAGLVKSGFDKLSRSDMLKQAASARLGSVDTAATPQSTAAMVADTYGGAANVPPNIIANMSEEDKQALTGLYVGEATAQPAPAIAPLATAAPDGQGPGMVAEAKSVAQEDERRARSVEATNLEDEQKFIQEKEAKLKNFQSLAKQYTDTAKQLGLLASMEEDPVEARALKEEARQARLMAVAELRKISNEKPTGVKTVAPSASPSEIRFSPEVARVGDQLIGMGTKSVEDAKMRIMEKENASPKEQSLLGYLEEMAPGQVGEVGRVPDVVPAVEPAPQTPGQTEDEVIAEGNDIIARGKNIIESEIYYLKTAKSPSEYKTSLLKYLEASKAAGYKVPAVAPVIPPTPEIAQPPVTPSAPVTGVPVQSGVAQQAPVQQAPATPFDLTTAGGIYAAAKQARTPQQQAMVMQAASQVLRPERKAPTTIFEAFGAGGPTQAGARQLALVNSMFPKVKTQTEKDLANAELARARAEQARAQARLIGEKGMSEGAWRSAKLGTEIAKEYKLRASASAVLDQAKAALIRANKSGRGRSRGLSNLKRAVKDATAKNKNLRRSAEAQNRASQTERRMLSKFGDPGPKPVWTRKSVPARTAAGQAHLKRLRKWEKENRDYTAAKERLEAIDASINMNNTIIDETFKNDADILEDAKKGVASVRASLKQRSKRKAPKTPKTPSTTPRTNAEEGDALRKAAGGK